MRCKKSEVTMKNSSSTGAKLFSRAFLPLIAAVVLVTTGARAGLTLEMNVIRYHQYGYYFYPGLTTNTTPPNVSFGDYFIASSGQPTNGSSGLYQFSTNGFNQIGGVSYGYGDFDSMMHELTNGTWSIFVTNSVTTNVYHFTVTANINSNAMPIVSITFPADGAVNVTNQPTFTWQGPTNYSGLVVYYYNSGDSLPVTQTSLLSPIMLYQGINNFTAHYDSNSTTAVVSSVPLDNASQPISSWVSTAHLQDYSSSQFTVGTVDTSGTSHTLVAHYAWDGTNGDGTASGVDTSGNGYNMNFGGSFGGQGGANSTTNTAAGPRAIQFHDGDGNSAGYVGWNPTPPSLLAALAGSFSVSCWIKTTQNNSGWDQAPAYYGAGIVSADNGGLANDVIPLALTGNKIGFNTGGDVEDVTLNSTASVNDGIYHHIVVTRNQLTGQKIIYIDGVLDSFSSGTTNRLNNPLLLTIGALSDARDADASSAYYYNGYDGELDDVQIYSGVLSAGEVASLHASPGSTAANGGGSSSGHTNVAHYAFNNSGNLGEDSSGNGNDAPGMSWWGPQHQFDTNAEAGGGAVQFFGTSYLNPYDQPLTNLNAVLAGSFTCSAWVKTTVTNGADDNNAFYGAVIFWAYNDQGNTNDTIPLAITGSKAAFTTRDHLGNFDTLHSISSVNDGNYHLITVTRDQGSGVKKIYVDGNFETLDIGTTDPLNGNNYNLTIGGYAYLIDSLNTNYSSYKGLLDDVQIYSGVLSAGDVASLYANPGSTIANGGGPGGGHTNLLYYSFEDGNIFATDYSPNGNNVSSISSFGGGTAYTTNVQTIGSYAAYFSNNGGSGASWLNPPTNLLATLARTFSISLRVNTTQTTGTDTDDGLYGNAGLVSAFNGPGDNWVIPMAITGNKLAFATGGSSQSTLHSTSDINTGSYVQLVVTRNQSTGEKKIYVNGVLEATGTGSTDSLDNPTEFNIGYNNGVGFDGRMDEIQIYSGVLSDSEVLQLYNNPGTAIPDSAGGGSDFNQALNTTNLTWTTGGNLPWFVETTNTHDNVSAAQSGAITDNQESWIETTVTGPGNLSYWLKVSSEQDYDRLEFLIDGSPEITITGEFDWFQQIVNISSGSHALRWRYYKDGSDSAGLDAGFLDQVSYVATPLVITLNPFNQTNSPGYQVALLAAATSNAAITWQWFKTSDGSISGATNALFIPTNSGAATVAGNYFAIATSTNGSATTDVASVTFSSAALPAEWSAVFKSPFSTFTSGALNNMNAGDYYYGCLADADNNLYAVGQFYGNHTINTTNQLVTVNPGASIVKHTTSGGTLWAAGVTNNGHGQAYATAVSAAVDGGVFVVGNFTGTNWLGTNLLVAASTNGNDIFLAHFTTGGSNVWVKTISSTNSDFALLGTAATDLAGNLTVAGIVSAPANFAGTNVSSSGQVGFLAQFDRNGSPRWVQIITNSLNIVLASSGSLLYAVAQNGGDDSTLFIGGQNITSDRRWILAALNPTNGQSLWLRGFGPERLAGNPLGIGDDVPRFNVSGTNILIVGTAYTNRAVFGAITVNFPTNHSQYFVRYDTQGTPHAAAYLGSEFTAPYSLVADAAGNSYFTGDFENYSDFSGHIIAGYPRGRIAANPTYFSHSYITKLDLNGNAQWSRPGIATASYLGYNNANYANFRGITRTSDGRVWAAGLMWGQANFYTNLLTSDREFVSMQAFPVRTAFMAAVSEITVAPALPITLLNPQSNGANFQFQFQSQAGFTHAVQYKTNLAVGNWQTYSNVTGDGALKTIPIPLSVFNPAKQGFVRVSTQ
jgi:hypothetical protein